MEEWLYDRGPCNLMATVRFRDGVVQTITYGHGPGWQRHPHGVFFACQLSFSIELAHPWMNHGNPIYPTKVRLEPFE
jgi:hypothetical protein